MRSDQLFSGNATKIEQEVAALITSSFQIAMDAGMADDIDYVAEADTMGVGLIVALRGGRRLQITISPATASERKSPRKET